MNIPLLRQRYRKAHEGYLKYKDTNKTNNTEAEFLPEILKHTELFQNHSVFVVPDSFLNYVGTDLIDLEKGATYDVKICQHCRNLEVLIDAYKKDEKGNWINALDLKINDFFIFLNADNIILVPYNEVLKRIPTNLEGTFFMKRDLYKTTRKAVVDLSTARKITISRNTN